MTRIGDVAALIDNRLALTEEAGTLHDADLMTQDLVDEGHLLPDLPEPHRAKFDNAAIFTRDEDAEDGAYIDVKVDTEPPTRGRITVDLDPSSGGKHGFTRVVAYVNPQWCREAATLLLAAADHAERNQE
ncbi:hypothetical protein AALF15_01215 [Corynebacteriaceae bacterium 7-707]